MSKRNSTEAKQAARERLRAERERQEKRRRIRRRLTVAGTAVAILAAATGIGAAVAAMGDGDDNTDWGAVRAQIEAADNGEGSAPEDAFPTGAPANTSGEDGLTIRVGEESAANTLMLFEDPRCPACASFEQTAGPEVERGLQDGTYAVEFVFGTFLDGNLGGSGSKNALNALGAALDVSPEAFLAYHEALYSAEFHPSESSDAFADDERLIEIAESVPGLRNNQRFEDAVENSTFAVWALRMSDTFDADPDVSGTPTLKYNGEVVEIPQTPEDFTAIIEANSETGTE